NATYLYQASVDVNLEKKLFAITNNADFSEQAIYQKLQSEVQEFLQGVMSEN
ncbi:MAG: hypothetical protein K0Q87_2269, partial [Neobacillus sp.]|nr:hypothetical protein [Neobacillus sp.]